MREKFGIEVIGVDIGGSHIAAGEVFLEGKNVLAGTTKRKMVDSHASSELILKSWGDFLRGFIHEKNPDRIRVGIAMPGPFDYEKGVSYIKELNKYDALYGVDVKSWLAEYLNISASNILFRNDAEAFLHGEVMHRNGLGGVKTVGITLGTGLGSAVSENGKTRDVFRAIAPMKQGIAEDYISSRWFSKRYNELCRAKLESVEVLANGEDPCKTLLFEEFAANLAAFLDDFMGEEDASVVIIGGNIAKCLDLFIDTLKCNMRNKEIDIYQSALWEDAALLGAAYLWNDEFSAVSQSEKKEIKIC